MTKRKSILINSDLHAKFKTKTAQMELSMVKVVERLINLFIDANSTTRIIKERKEKNSANVFG